MLENEIITSEEIKAINDTIKSYIDEYSKSERYSKYFTPALWLHVPNEWKRVN
jgi:hypothetical protein